MRRFRSSASKSKMVSLGGRIVSSQLPNETRSRKLQYLQQHQSSIALVSVFHWPGAAGPRRRHRRPARRPAGKTLSKQAAPPQQTARSPSPSAAGSNEPKSCSLQLLQVTCNLCQGLRVGPDSQPGTMSWAAASMLATKRAWPSAVGRRLNARLNLTAFPTRQIDGAVPRKAEGVRICGAMSQQHGDGGQNVSAPQKFLRLVGCRDPNARTWVRPHPAPPKR